MKTVYKAQLLQKRKWRIRKKVTGTAARPRLSVKFSGKHIYAQAVNDDAGTATQANPNVAIGPAGRVDVIWRDKRHAYDSDSGRT